MNKLARSTSAEKQELDRITELYKLYGSDMSALVNPAHNPYLLKVQNRDHAERKLDTQVDRFNKSKMSNFGADDAISVNVARVQVDNQTSKKKKKITKVRQKNNFMA